MKLGPDRLVFIGTYSDAIYHWRFPQAPTIAANLPRPSYLAIHPKGRFLYAVSEEPAGSVSAWKIDPNTGALAFANRVGSGGAGPCHIAIDLTGSLAVVANYAGASVSAIRIRPDGSLGEILAAHQNSGSGPLPRQSRAHPHGAFFSPDNRLVIVPDLGIDKLFLYRPEPSFDPADPPFVELTPACGPRHFAFHPRGGYGYALCELNSTISAFHCDATGLKEFATESALPPGYCGENIAAGLAIDDAGRFLYCSNRGADTIGAFAIGAQGKLSVVQHTGAEGRTPRHIAIDPSGNWLLAANQDSDSVAVFRRDPVGGRLAPTGLRGDVPAPACIVFL
jgi:6-phosphogluconolactonase